MRTFEIEDVDGDRVKIERSNLHPGKRVYLTARHDALVTPEQLRELADAADEITGTSRKATDETPAPWSEDRQALVEAAKDLLRRAAGGDLDGELVVFLGSRS